MQVNTGIGYTKYMCRHVADSKYRNKGADRQDIQNTEWDIQIKVQTGRDMCTKYRCRQVGYGKYRCRQAGYTKYSCRKVECTKKDADRWVGYTKYIKRGCKHN
jgi:hypothetical protein